VVKGPRSQSVIVSCVDQLFKNVDSSQKFVLHYIGNLNEVCLVDSEHGS
jgi:hypothetical protein